MHQFSDEELITQFRAGGSTSQRCLEELFSRHYRRVALWCFRYTGNRDSAGDLAQEVFIRVQRGLDSFGGNSKFTTWLYTVSRNVCLNHSNSRLTKPEVSSEAELRELADPSIPDFGMDLEQKQRLEQAQHWVREVLDETERKVFTLHYGEEMPIEAITRELRLTNPSGAKAYVVSARRKLHEAVRRWRAKHELA